MHRVTRDNVVVGHRPFSRFKALGSLITDTLTTTHFMLGSDSDRDVLEFNGYRCHKPGISSSR